MTTNETIARWLDYKLVDDALVKGVPGRVYLESPSGGYLGEFEPDADITIWHGGLLAEIRRHGPEMMIAFTRAYLDGVFGADCWDWDFDEDRASLFEVIDEDPAQLATALVKVIEEGK